MKKNDRQDRLQRMAAWYGASVPRKEELEAWFLERAELSYEYYLSGHGAMFRARSSCSSRLRRVERLDLALELLDMSEVCLWHALGEDIRKVNLARFRKCDLPLYRCRTIASCLGISEAWLAYGHLPMLMRW